MTSLLPPFPPEALTFGWLAKSVFFPFFQLFLLLSARSFLACLPSPPRVPNGNSDCLYPSPLDCEPYVDRELVNPFFTTVSPAPSSVRHCRLPLNERVKAQETESPGVPEPAATSQDHQMAQTTYSISTAVLQPLDLDSPGKLALLRGCGANMMVH